MMHPSAASFLACLLGPTPAGALTFQTFDDEKPGGAGRRDLARILTGGLSQHAAELERLNQGGAGVFVTVNGTDGQGRKKENVSMLRGLWADLDEKDAQEPFDVGAILASLPLEPTMASRTPGGLHLYWIFQEPIPCPSEARRAEHEADLKAIRAHLAPWGADAKVCDVGRVMRLPGFLHRKAEPRMVELLKVDGPRYAVEQLRTAFPAVTRASEPGGGEFPFRPVSVPGRLELLDRAVRFLDTLPEGIQGQNGSGATFNAALKVMDAFDLSEDEALGLMLDHYNPRCVPPWSVDELRKKVKDAAPHCRNRGHLLALPAGSHEPPPLPPPPGDQDAPPSTWEHPTMPMPEDPRSPWIVGDVRRMLREEPPPVRWLVEGLIPAGQPGLFAARAGAGKSMTSLLIALGLASGRGVLGRPVSPDAPRGVLYVGLEDDEPEFWRRLKNGVSLMKEEPRWTPGDEEQVAKRLVPLFPDRLAGSDFRLEDQWKSLRDHAQAIPGGCGLIVLDTLSRLSSGDENSAKETRPFLEAQAALAQATGAAVMAIHHVGKGNDTPSDKKLWERLHPEALRGSSAIEASARFILTMAALSPGEAERAGLELEHALKGGYVALHLAKMSQAEKGATVLLERRSGPGAGAGFLCPHPDSERVLALLQGESAVLKLNLRDKVLLAIAETGGLLKLDQDAAAAQLWPSASNPKGQLQKQLTELRKRGWLNDPHLTEAGWAHAESMGFNSARKRVGATVTENGQDSRGLPPGSGETEEVEEKVAIALPSIPGAHRVPELEEVAGVIL